MLSGELTQKRFDLHPSHQKVSDYYFEIYEILILKFYIYVIASKFLDVDEAVEK